MRTITQFIVLLIALAAIFAVAKVGMFFADQIISDYIVNDNINLEDSAIKPSAEKPMIIDHENITISNKEGQTIRVYFLNTADDDLPMRLIVQDTEQNAAVCGPRGCTEERYSSNIDMTYPAMISIVNKDKVSVWTIKIKGTNIVSKTPVKMKIKVELRCQESIKLEKQPENCNKIAYSVDIPVTINP